MKFRLFLQRAMIAAIVAAGVYYSVRNLQAASALGDLNTDPITQWEARFQAVKKLLPFKRGTVGYLTNSDVPGAAYGASNEEGEYTLTQYTMAPIIIVRGTNEAWIIAILNAKAFQIWNQSNHGQFRVIPLNDNIYLIHRVSQ